MDRALFDELLRRGESESLDFKSAQYPFIGATDEQKAELLKDILAMANSWRDRDAYILIGVEEGNGMAHACGVSEHLRDADLQQLLASRVVPRRLVFSYSAFDCDGVGIGVIHIPVQQRPFWVEKQFGALRPRTVYVRRGSSTREADPGEVAEMGHARATREQRPELVVEFGDCGTRVRFGSERLIEPLVWKPIPEDELPIHKHPAAAAGFGFSDPLRNGQYYKQLCRYMVIADGTAGLGFAVQNLSSVVAHDVRVQLRFQDCPGLRVMGADDYPSAPEEFFNLSPAAMASHGRGRSDVWANRYGTEWQVTLDVGKVQPRCTVWLADMLYLGSHAPIDLTLEGEVSADNMEPQPTRLILRCNPSHREMTRRELLERAKESRTGRRRQ